MEPLQSLRGAGGPEAIRRGRHGPYGASRRLHCFPRGRASPGAELPQGKIIASVHVSPLLAPRYSLLPAPPAASTIRAAPPPASRAPASPAGPAPAREGLREDTPA